MKNIFSLMLMGLFMSVYGQVKISGEIFGYYRENEKDSVEKRNLENVQIFVKGTQNKTFSNQKGNYKINAKQGDEIVFSHPDFEEKIYIIKDKKGKIPLDVNLKKGDMNIIGYFTTFRDKRKIEPLLIVDGKIFNKNPKKLNPNKIESLRVMKPQDTIITHPKAENGIIIIKTKK